MIYGDTIIKPVAAADEILWSKKDEKALAPITLNLSKTELGHIRKTLSSKQAWDDLERIHSSRGPVRKAILYKQTV